MTLRHAPEPRAVRRWRALRAAALAAAWLGAVGSAHADAALALDKGCFSCHGEPPRGKARRWRRWCGATPV